MRAAGAAVGAGTGARSARLGALFAQLRGRLVVLPTQALHTQAVLKGVHWGARRALQWSLIYKQKEGLSVVLKGSCHKRQKPQTPTPQAPIRNRQTRKVANAKGLNRNTNLT